MTLGKTRIAKHRLLSSLTSRPPLSRSRFWAANKARRRAAAKRRRENPRTERRCPNGCGVCSACIEYPGVRKLRSFGQHHSFQDVILTDHGAQLKPRGYRCKDIVEHTIEYISRGVMGPYNFQKLQERALERWRIHWNKHGGICLNRSNLSDIRFYFDIFDQYFFCGTLRSTKIKWMQRLENAYALTTSSSGNTIFICCSDGRIPRTPEGDSWILAVLLHEMVHVMLMRYQCRCCCRVNTVGFTGHGTSWWNLKSAVESEADRSFTEGGNWYLVFPTAKGTNVSYKDERKEIHKLEVFNKLHQKTMLWELRELGAFKRYGRS